MNGIADQDSPQSAQVLIVGFDSITRRTLYDSIGNEKDLVVSDTDDLHHVMEVQGVSPDVVILIRNEGDNADQIHRIKQHWSSAKVIVVCPSTQASPCVDMIETGVMGVVSKHEMSEQIVEAIRSVLRGCVYCEQCEGQPPSHWFG